MTDELTWIKAEITKLLVAVAMHGAPSTKNLARSLGDLLTGYNSNFGRSIKSRETFYIADAHEYEALVGRLHNDYGDNFKVVDLRTYTTYTYNGNGAHIPKILTAAIVEIYEALEDRPHNGGQA